MYAFFRSFTAEAMTVLKAPFQTESTNVRHHFEKSFIIFQTPISTSLEIHHSMNIPLCSRNQYNTNNSKALGIEFELWKFELDGSFRNK